MAKGAAGERTNEDLQNEILEVELQTKKLNLAQAKRANEEYEVNEARRHERNKMRQANLAEERAMRRSNQKACAHMSGGEAGSSPLEGGGKFAFSVITRAIMPDGKTELLQCPRCRLALHGREFTTAEEAKLVALAKEGDKKAAAKLADHEWWKELRKISRKEGIPHNEMRGPTFMFQNDKGVNFIPDMV